MSRAWLQRQRKPILLELSEQAGLKQDEELRKDDIVEALDDHLQQNAPRLALHPAFEGYFATKRATPFKPRISAAELAPGADGEAKSTVKGRSRRITKVKLESEDEDANFSPVPIIPSGSIATSAVTSALSPSAQLASRTPVTRSRTRPQLPGPPSPAVVADIVEAESTRLVAGLRDIWFTSHIGEHIATVREKCSSVTSIQLTFLAIEAFALQRRLVPWDYAFDIPATGFTPSVPVFLPDLFILLTGFFWSTTLLWTFTSILIPLIFAYFYNLTIQEVKRGSDHVTVPRYQADPLTYNVVKALATWLVYAKGVSFGLIGPEVAERVEGAIYGGYPAILIGSGVGALAALYEAAQSRTIS